MSKSKSTSIWYPRYCGDYQRKTAHLSLIEHGVYSVLLDYYYSSGKPLPVNAEQLHRICRAFAPDEQAALQSVIQQFFILDGDVYRNHRADEELARRLDISEKRAESARSRGQKYDAIAYTNAEQLQSNCTPFADTVTVTVTTKEKKKEYTSDFLDFWKTYPRRDGSKSEAFKSYLKAKKETSHETIMDGLAKYIDASRGKDAQYIAHAATWLNGKRWESEYITQTTEKPKGEVRRFAREG